MRIATRRSVSSLLALLFVFACVHGFAMPDWHRTLRDQGYYDYYVDLATSLFSDAPNVVAGGQANVLVTVENRGPDTARQVVGQAVGNQNAVIIGASGCQNDNLPGNVCQLPQPIAAGSQSDFLLAVQVPPDALGLMTLAVSVDSAGSEIQPGDELALIKLPIVTLADLRVLLENRNAALTPGVPFRYRLSFSNAGPSSTSRVNLISEPVGFQVASAGWQCSATGIALCPAATGNGLPQAQSLMLPAASSLVFEVTMIATALQGSNVSLISQIVSDDGSVDDDLSNNQNVMVMDEALFNDHFE
ncbi:MAG: hypothetical protein Tsb002_20010 [Wenzhouxiangellaceae bacterium]